MVFRQRSISTSMTTGLVVTVIFIVATLLAVQYITQSRTARAEIEQKADEYVGGLTSILAIPLWTLDTPNIKHIGKAYQQNDVFSSLEIIDSHGVTLFSFNKSSQSGKDILREQDIFYEKEKVGHLCFSLSLSGYRSKLNSLIGASLLTLTVSTLVILLATGALLRVFLRKPLAALESGMDAVSRGDFTTPFEKAEYTELENIVSTFKEMAATIQARESALIQMNKRLSREVAERKMAEKAKAKSESTLKAIFNATPIGIGLVNDRIPSWTNEGLLKMVGYSSEELEGKPIRQLYPTEEEYLRVGNVMYTALEKDTTVTIESIWKVKNGNLLDVLISLSRIVPDDPDQGYVFAAMDITTRKIDEALREEMIEELEDKNAELERFTYTVSHDLKSPIITIKGFLGMLERDMQAQDTKRIKSDMDRIHHAADKMQQLLDELLDLSRIGRLVNPPEDIDLNRMALDIKELLFGRIRQGGITVNIQPDLPTIRGDRPRIQEVFQNLVDNAAKFMGEQENPIIEIGSCETAQGEAFFIRDNGIGIKKEHFGKIFGLFDQLDPNKEGTGIGLALVQRIVETHGGKVWLESPGQGHGTTFYLTLPRVDKKTGANATPTA